MHTSIYHPQCNRLVEHFNKTLKGMLRKFAIDNPSQWLQLIEPVLFAVQEVPQASMGFSPFELLFGRKPRGVLDLDRDQWVGETRNKNGKKSGMDLGTLRAKLEKLAEWAKKNLAEAQQNQKERYDARVRVTEFKPGDKVLLLLPSSDTKLIAKWQGPYEVNKRIGPVDYEIRTPDKREELKIFHVNLLKAWKEGEKTILVTEELGPCKAKVMGATRDIGKGDNLSPAQKLNLAKLQAEFPKVFSKKPGKTSLIQHKIKIKGNKIIRLGPRKWPKHVEEVLIEEVQTMWELEVIEPSCSEWRSYPVMVPKPNGST